MKHIISTVLLYAVFTTAFAQTGNITLSGKVISFEESFPLEGVSIWVKGTKNATGTQADGTFSITVNAENKILVISQAEYESQEISITNNKKEYEIVLKRADK